MTEIQLTNSATHRKETFEPIDAENVRMYVCGPTVYDRAHMGNARPAIVFDALYRLLRHVYGVGHVTYVRNITDVDDKINARAAETGRSIGEIADETTAWYLEDMAALGTLVPDATPRATAYIDEMIAMIGTLVEGGYAYEVEGHVLFSVGSYDGYGTLSGRSVEDMIAGARVEVAPYKRDAMDFVLWKPSGEGQPGWPSPWGMGRPGWHIECSAMARELLGESFDIHGGGGDLIFPHHENEVAQSACAHGGKMMARVWMHNEMLQVDGRKMSKSLGNFYTVRDLLDEGVPGAVIRMAFLLSHYRSPMNLGEARWHEARVAVAELAKVLGAGGEEMRKSLKGMGVPPHEEVVAGLADDLDTAGAVAALRKLCKAKPKGEAARAEHLGRIRASQILLGFDLVDGETCRDMAAAVDQTPESVELPEHLARALTAISEARAAKDYETADRVRGELEAAGVEVQIGRGGAHAIRLPHYDASKLRGRD